MLNEYAKVTGNCIVVSSTDGSAEFIKGKIGRLTAEKKDEATAIVIDGKRVLVPNTMLERVDAPEDKEEVMI